MEKERATMKEGVVVLLLLDNGELSGLLDDARRLVDGMTYEMVLAERRLVEDLSGVLGGNRIQCSHSCHVNDMFQLHTPAI